MSFLHVNEIRNKFLNYFQENDHQWVHSASLVPDNEDKTLLFTNSGMVPFKNLFLGYETRNYQRAVSIQRCLRAGGKHNDLDNVGYTARHHTFFEMLGNFSFGDYFKEKAIYLAWVFLTEELALPKEKLWITVHHSDDEAADIWHHQIGIAKARIIRCGDADNFWSMGSTGPCGPCSEIFYDHGEHVAGGPPGSADEDGDRYVEVWNLVFMQYNRDTDGTLTPLPNPSVDTGMGLERIATVLQGKTNNYDTNELATLVAKAQSLVAMDEKDKMDKENPSFKVLADHIRACAFLIADGILPGNEGRGYVLRRIIRRAIRHGHKVGIKQSPFFDQLLIPLVDCMGQNYPELVKSVESIREILQQEELRFSETLKKGLSVFQQKLEEDSTIRNNQCVDGELIFYLYDTFGFPVDLTADMARELDLNMDYAGFDQAMAKQKEQARAAMRFDQPNINLPLTPVNNFVGYEVSESGATIVGMFDQQAQAIETLQTQEEGFIVLDQCPFYSESGGQVSDTGVIVSEDMEFMVYGMHKQGHTYVCYGKLTTETCVTVGKKVRAIVDSNRRQPIEKNHSGTHLLHHVLRQYLGKGVAQKGSLVDEHKLRFDFSYGEKIPDETLAKIEQKINQHIQQNHPVETHIMPLEEAKKLGAMALFGEKYGDEVRVVKIGESIELCGGTHVSHCGRIGLLKIISEGSVATGVRRIEALTGKQALNHLNQQGQTLQTLSHLCKVPNEQLSTFIAQLLEKQKQLKSHISTLEKALTDSQAVEIQTMGHYQVIVQHLGQLEGGRVRQKIDEYKQKIKSGIVIIATDSKGKGQLACGVTDDLTHVIKANDLVNKVAKYADGKGGGREGLAMASADPSKIQHAFEGLEKVLSEY